MCLYYLIKHAYIYVYTPQKKVSTTWNMSSPKDNNHETQS